MCDRNEKIVTAGYYDVILCIFWIMSDTTRIRMDLGDFVADAKKLAGDKYPRAVADALRLVTERVMMTERAMTREKFNLHGEFIPNSIKAFPSSSGQINKVARDIRDTSEAFASVYLGNIEKTEFMSMQEFGGTRVPLGKVLTVPQSDYQMKTSGGRVKQIYKPKTVLKDYAQTKFSAGSKHPGVYGTHQRRAFILNTANGTTIIARRAGRKRKPLKILYVMTPNGKIRAKWTFEETGVLRTNEIYRMAFDVALRHLAD